MASLNVSHDYPDLDEILDVGDPEDFVSGGLEPASLSVYDDSYIEDLSHLCSENSEITQQHYQSKVKTQTEDFSKHHDEGLLEALQRSMENFESSTMSDLASLSSSLGIAYPNDDLSLPSSTGGGFMDQIMMTDQLSTGTENTTPVQSPEEEELVSVDEQTDMDDDKADSSASVLRQLLLNPNDNYRKEIDTVSNSVDHIEKALGNVGNSREIQRQNRKMKKKKLPKKPFTELLKHLESSNSNLTHQVCAGTTKAKTRVLNARNYMRQYGSAPVSRVNSPEPEATMTHQKKSNSRSTTLKTNGTKTSRTTTTIIPKKPLQVTKIYPISHSSIATLQMDRKTENMIVAPDLNSLLALFESESPQNLDFNSTRKDTEALTFRPSTDKRKGTVLIEPLPKKRPRTSQDDSTKKDEPICQTTNRICHEKPSSDHDYCVSSVPSSVESLSIGDTNKVVQWEEYLQRVRSGTRSAPNSPTNSPKLQRSNSRKNKDTRSSVGLVSAPIVPASQTSPTNTPVTCSKLPSKPTIKLQKFQEYLANLQNKPSSNSISIPSAEIIVSSSAAAVGNAAKAVQTTSPLTLNVAPGKPIVQQTTPITLSQSFIQVKSGGKIHTAAVTSSQTGPHQSAPMVVIRIPAQQNMSNTPVINAVPLSQKSPVSVSLVTSPTSVVSGTKRPLTTSTLPVVHRTCSSTSSNSNKKVSVVTKSTSCAKKTGVSHSTQTLDEGSSPTSPKTTSPTFKLMTSSKGKSLILSNVTGQLKEILTALARQQQQQGYKSQGESSTSQQQKTLQKLLATITNMKKKQSGDDVVSTPCSVTSCDTMVTTVPSLDHGNGVNTNKGAEISSKNPEENTVNCDPAKNPSLATERHFDRSEELSSTQIKSMSTENSSLNCDVELPESFITSNPLLSCRTSSHSININQKTNRSPVNQYLNSVVKSTVDNLVQRVVERCQRDDTLTGSSYVGHLIQPHFGSASTFKQAQTSCSMTTSDSLMERQLINCANEAALQTNQHPGIDPTSNETHSTASVSETTTDDGQYYNKLPAYLYSGKLLQQITRNNQPETGRLLSGSLKVGWGNPAAPRVTPPSLSRRPGTDEDPNHDECQKIEYNKLPHYFSSGKLAPREDPLYGSRGHLVDVGMEQEISCTPEGAVIDPEETFYSRLPSYYSYGRSHVVDTVTEPPNHPDEIVTRESLSREDQKRKQKLEEKERQEVEKHKQRENDKPVLHDDHRILYSKIPSYLLSGRQSLASERRLSEEASSLSNSSDSEGATSTSSRRRSKLLKKPPSNWDYKIRKRKEEETKNQAIVQRRVMYVGGISEVTSQPYLRSRFQKFGTIDDVTLHYRKGKDNYAFVTFRYSNDVMEAIEHGNDDELPKYTLCLGGRRQFCKVAYADLDDEKELKRENENEEDFDTLLRQAMRR